MQRKVKSIKTRKSVAKRFKITASGKYAAHDPAAVDGTETAVAVL